MKTFKFLSIFLALALLLGLCALPAAAVAAPTVSAPNALVLDRRSGEAIFEKNADAKVWPASTTKIMTTLLAVEAVERGEIDIDEPVTCPAAALEGLSTLGSSAGIKAGEILTLRQLLLCAMVSSANEAGNIIAFRLAGGIEAFTAQMTARAEELGCTGTHFANTHGLPNLEHYTTVADMGRIALEAMKHPLFVEICSTSSVEIPATNLSPARKLNNSNALISRDGLYGGGYLYEGATGVKTGHTTPAGYCLVSAASRNGVDLLTLVYGCTGSDACFRDTVGLLDWVFKNYSYRTLCSTDENVGEVSVRDGDLIDTVELRPAEDFILLLPNDCDPGSFTREITIFGAEDGATLTGPLKAGTVLGRMELMRDGETFGGVDLIPASSSALIMDRRSGEILYGKGLDNRVYPADTVKLMTALLTVESVETGKHSYNDMATVTEAVNIDLDDSSIRCGLQVGEQLTLEALLQCALIASADDAANMLAEFVGGTVPEFVGMMNERAAALGCSDTAFTNAHGAYHSGQYTTARDFSRIAVECTRHERLLRICGTAVSELPETNLTPARTLKNTNALLCDESPYGADYLYEDADGLKAGYNPQSGYALISTAERSGMDLLCCVFGGAMDESGCSSFTDTVTLFDWVFNNYSYQEVLKSTENIASVDVALGMDSSYVNLRPATSITVLLPNDESPADFQKDIRVYALENRETVTAPVTAGQVLGEVTVSRDGRSYGTVKLVASSTVQLSRIQYIRQQVQETTRQRSFRIAVIILGLLFVAYLVWVIIYRVKRLRHLRAVRAAERERLLQAEAMMKHAEEPGSPGIRFFNDRGETEPQALPKSSAPAAEPAAGAPTKPRVQIDVPIDDAPAETAETPEPPLPDNVVTLFPGGAKPSEAEPEAAAEREESGDLLAGAVLAATLEPPQIRAETPEEKAERDYFEEFFRPKK